MDITSPRQLPEGDGYLFGVDLARSGWGPFGDEEADAPWDSFAGIGSMIRTLPPERLCVVAFVLRPETDRTLLKFNCSRCDVHLLSTVAEPRGAPGKAVPHTWALQVTRRQCDHDTAPNALYREREAMNPTGAFAVATRLFEEYAAPFIHVMTPETTSRWYTQPALGWTFYDVNDVPYRYCDPRDAPKAGDWALCPPRGWPHAPHEEREVRRLTSAYSGDYYRFKVIPGEDV